jgi:hypothetical protein
MQTYRLGLLYSDYTHAPIYATYLQHLGWEIAGASVRSNVWRREELLTLNSCFPKISLFDEISELLDSCDAFLCCNADYSKNLALVKEVAFRDKAIFLDKPACGIVNDVEEIRRLAKDGARVFLGTSFIHSPTIERLRDRIRQRGCETIHLYAAQEMFEHGIHAAELANFLLESRPVTVEAAELSDTLLVEVEFESGFSTKLFLEGPGFLFAAVVADSTEGWHASTIDISPHLDCHFARKAREFDAFVKGQPVAFNPFYHLDGILALIAAQESLRVGKAVHLADLAPENGFHSASYAAEYAFKRRQSKLVNPNEQARLLAQRELTALPGLREIVGRGKRLARRVAGGVKRRATRYISQAGSQV